MKMSQSPVLTAARQELRCAMSVCSDSPPHAVSEHKGMLPRCTVCEGFLFRSFVAYCMVLTSGHGLQFGEHAGRGSTGAWQS